MSHQDVIKRMADSGSEFARELLRRKMERLKPDVKPEPKPEVRSDEDIIDDITTPIDEFFAAATRFERKKDELQ